MPREQSKRKLAMEKVFVAIFLTLILLAAKLRLAFKIVQVRTDFNVFNFSLALCLTVSGSRFKEALREQLKKTVINFLLPFLLFLQISMSFQDFKNPADMEVALLYTVYTVHTAYTACIV